MYLDDVKKRLLKLEKKQCCCKPKFYDAAEDFPLEGKIDTLYIDKSSGVIYTWNGTVYQYDGGVFVR